VVQGIEFYMPLEDLIDVDVEKSRLKKEIARLEKQLLSLNTKLADSNFLSRAPKEIVEKQQKKKQTFEENLKKLTSNMSMLNN
jgi:valyl-tRNA synthetase